MKLFLYLYAIVQLVLSACILSLISHSGCGIEHIPMLRLYYPHWAVMSIVTLSIGIRKSSAAIILLAGMLMWYPTALSWSAICSCHGDTWLPPVITLATILPLVPAYVQTTRQNTSNAWVLCLLYLVGALPAIMLLQRML